jgi:hypothetical protein
MMDAGVEVPPALMLSQLPPCDTADVVKAVLAPLESTEILCGAGVEPSAGTKNDSEMGATKTDAGDDTFRVTCTV